MISAMTAVCNGMATGIVIHQLIKRSALQRSATESILIFPSYKQVKAKEKALRLNKFRKERYIS